MPHGYQQYNRGNRSHYSDRREQSRAPLPSIQFVKDGELAADLFDKQAKQAAEVVADCKLEENKSTQLRRFYDELVMWLDHVEQSPDRFASYLPMIRMLKAKAAYARGRKLVDQQFESLLGQIVDHATDPNRLRHSKLFFEAFLGFYKLEKGDN